MVLVDSYFRRIDTERGGDVAKGAFPVLGRRPDFRAPARYMRRAGHRLHGRVCEIGDLVISAHDGDPAREGFVDISDSAADGDVTCLKTAGERFSDRVCGETSAGSLIPGNRKGLTRHLRLPP